MGIFVSISQGSDSEGCERLSHPGRLPGGRARFHPFLTDKTLWGTSGSSLHYPAHLIHALITVTDQRGHERCLSWGGGLDLTLEATLAIKHQLLTETHKEAKSRWKAGIPAPSLCLSPSLWLRFLLDSAGMMPISLSYPSSRLKTQSPRPDPAVTLGSRSSTAP